MVPSFSCGIIFYIFPLLAILLSHFFCTFAGKNNKMSTRADFEHFYQQHYMQLFLYAKRLVPRDDELCRDIVGDALAQTWAKIGDIEKGKLRNYTYTLIHGMCVNHIRHTMAANRYADFYLKLYGTHDDENDWMEHEQLVATILQLLNELPPRTRYVLQQCYFEKRRYADVAGELGISTNGVKKHIVSALKKLRVEMAKNHK